MGRVQFSQCRPDCRHRNEGLHNHRQFGLEPFCESLCLAIKVIGVRDDLPRSRQKRAPLVRERGSVARPVKKQEPTLFLQTAYGVSHCGLCTTQLPRSCRETAGICDRDENHQLVECVWCHLIYLVDGIYLL